jgi:hypothetical protein
MIEPMRDDPELSVVMVVGEERDRAARAVAAVRAQAAHAALELVVVDLAPGGEPIVPSDGDLSVIVLDLADHPSWSSARHAGVAVARAPIVAFVEDHVYVEPGWAAALVAAYRARPDAVAVGYAFTNARDGGRPDGTLFAEYGRWVAPARDGPWRALPGNNVSYRRDALLALQDVGGSLAVDFTLHAELRRRGAFIVGPHAVVRHDGFPRLADTLRANHEYGRVLAAARVARGSWTRPRRALYAAGTPAVPALNALRLARTLPGRGLWRSALRHAPACLAIWAAAASGELVGYVTASGAEGERLVRWEVDVDRRVA